MKLHTLIPISILVICIGHLSNIKAVSPAPDGGYPNFTTAEGQNALLNLTSGVANTAIGSFSLESVTDGSFNTGIGADTLVLNTGDGNTAIGAAALLLNTTGANNTADGTAALVNNSTGEDNTAVGAFALNSNTASKNTAIGSNALQSNTTAAGNTAVGSDALVANTTGEGNTADGTFALMNNTEGDDNTASGFSALRSNTTGAFNTANGAFALFSNTTARFNTAIGDEALVSNTTGFTNTATGASALDSNTEGDDNTATGAFTLSANTTGGSNVANGVSTLRSNTTGSGNTAIGSGALFFSTGNFNTALGDTAGANVRTASNVICIGAPLVFGEDVSNSCYIGSIFGQISSGGTAVFINADGKLGTTTSSRRFKEEIKPMERSSEALFALEPVTFRYKSEIDPQGISQFGLVAEEVEAINPDLVVRDKEGKVNTVRYEAVNAMLLNEFLKEHRKVEELQAIVARQQKSFARQQAQIEALASGLQKVSAELEISRATPQVASLPAEALREGGNNP
jgi:Chaperone of endosialidase